MQPPCCSRPSCSHPHGGRRPPEVTVPRRASRLCADFVSRSRLVGSLVDDAEADAVRIDQDDEVFVPPVFPLVPGRAKAKKTVDLALLIRRLEIEVHPTDLPERRQRFRDAIEGDVGAGACRVGEHHPAVVRRLPRDVPGAHFPNLPPIRVRLRSGRDRARDVGSDQETSMRITQFLVPLGRT